MNNILILVNGETAAMVEPQATKKATADELWSAAFKYSGDITLGYCTDFVNGRMRRMRPLFWDNSIEFVKEENE